MFLPTGDETAKLCNSMQLDPAILARVQSACVFSDCKDFVDTHLLVSPSECLRRWRTLTGGVVGVRGSPPAQLAELADPPDSALREFVATTFSTPGGGLEAWEPHDWDASAPLISRLPRNELRAWATALHALWRRLGRRLTPQTLASPALSTLIAVPHPFIVPGGRFREGYYWDNYWVVLGLLASEMWESAKSTGKTKSPHTHLSPPRPHADPGHPPSIPLTPPPNSPPNSP